MQSANQGSVLCSNARWYEGVTGLNQLREDWMSLASGSQFFAHFEWYLAAASHLIKSPRNIWFCRLSSNKDRPLAIIPATPSSVTIRPFGNLPVVSLLGDNDQLALFDFPMSEDADTSSVGRAFLNALKELKFDWSLVWWQRVLADSNAARVAQALNPVAVDIVPTSVCNTFFTASVPDQALGYSVFTVESSSLRRNLAARTRRLAAQGEIKMRLAREEGKIDSFFEEFLRIEASGWKGNKGTATAISLIPSAKAFYRTLLDSSSPDFETDIALLYCGNQAVAGEFLIRTARWQHVYKMGYEDAFTNCSPGQILLRQVIERAKSLEAIDWISMVTGLDWHNDWHPIAEPTRQIGIFRARWRVMVVRMGRAVRARIKKTRHAGSTKPVENE